MNLSKLDFPDFSPLTVTDIEAAIAIRKVLYYECNLLEHFYSGDKDTFKEAYNNVIEKIDYGFKPNDPIDEDLFVEYESEIKKEFDDLVEFGKKEIQARQMFIDYLNKLIKTTDE